MTKLERIRRDLEVSYKRCRKALIDAKVARVCNDDEELAKALNRVRLWRRDIDRERARLAREKEALIDEQNNR